MDIASPFVYSFADLDKIKTAQKIEQDAGQLLDDFLSLMSNIIHASPEDVPDKITAMRNLIDELPQHLPDLMPAAGKKPDNVEETGREIEPAIKTQVDIREINAAIDRINQKYLGVR